MHVILDVYALLLLDHADPKFNISEKFPLSKLLLLKINFTDFKIFVLSPFKKCKTAIHTIHLSTPSFIFINRTLSHPIHHFHPFCLPC